MRMMANAAGESRLLGSKRRNWCKAMLAGAATPLLASCAGVGLPGQTLTPDQLADLVARAFPYSHDFSGLVELSIASPKLRLLPESNRLGTALQVALVERLTGLRLNGSMDLDYGLRFDAAEGAIRLADVRVNQLTMGRLPAKQQALVERYAPRVAELLLSNFILYRLPDAQLTLARSLGLVVGALRVQPDGLHMDFVREAGR